MMNYDIFKEVVKDSLNDYLPEQYKDMELRVCSVNKVNRMMDGINLIGGSEVKNVSPTIYINDMYDHYKACNDLKEAIQAGADRMVNAFKMCPEAPRIDFAEAKDNIVFQLVNTEQNKEMIAGVPHRDFQDLSIIYRWVIKMDDDGIQSTLIQNSLAEQLGVNEEQLFKMAAENTRRIFTPRIRSMNEVIFERYCKFLNSLDVSFKITINNKNKDMEQVRDYVFLQEKEDGFNGFRKIYNDIMEKKIHEGRQGIEQERYLTITIERKNFEEAKAQFATIEASIHKAFNELGADIVPLSGNERIKVLYDYYHLGDEGSFDFDIREAKKVGADFRNDLCNGMIQFYLDYFKDEKKYCRALFIKKYPSSLSDRFLNEITSLPVHSITSIDVVPIPKDMTTKILQKKYLGIESDIIKQQRVRNKNNDFFPKSPITSELRKKRLRKSWMMCVIMISVFTMWQSQLFSWQTQRKNWTA